MIREAKIFCFAKVSKFMYCILLNLIGSGLIFLNYLSFCRIEKPFRLQAPCNGESLCRNVKRKFSVGGQFRRNVGSIWFGIFSIYDNNPNYNHCFSVLYKVSFLIENHRLYLQNVFSMCRSWFIVFYVLSTFFRALLFLEYLLYQH